MEDQYWKEFIRILTGEGKVKMEFYYGISNSSSLCHFGTKEHSGRYKWGSGDRPYQRLGGKSSKRVIKSKKSGPKFTELKPEDFNKSKKSGPKFTELKPEDFNKSKKSGPKFTELKPEDFNKSKEAMDLAKKVGYGGYGHKGQFPALFDERAKEAYDRKDEIRDFSIKQRIKEYEIAYDRKLTTNEKKKVESEVNKKLDEDIKKSGNLHAEAMISIDDYSGNDYEMTDIHVDNLKRQLDLMKKDISTLGKYQSTHPYQYYSKYTKERNKVGPISGKETEEELIKKGTTAYNNFVNIYNTKYSKEITSGKMEKLHKLPITDSFIGETIRKNMMPYISFPDPTGTWPF